MLAKAMSLSVVVLLLSGCAGLNPEPKRDPAPPPPTVDGEPDACGARHVQDRVGRDYSQALGEAIREESGAAALRVLRPGEAHTLEYRDDRINVRLDDQDAITDIVCG
jgi:hypothetical protein